MNLPRYFLYLSLLHVLPLVTGFLSALQPLPGWRSVSDTRLSRPANSPYLELKRYPTRFASLSSSSEEALTSSTSTDRFQRTATQDTVSDKECILDIDGQRYNVSAWARAHPGGVNVLQKFHNKDASKAFHAAHHSKHAYRMLEDFVIDKHDAKSIASRPAVAAVKPHQWRQKLFSKEDPIGVHKYLGLFCLVHFTFRFYQMLFGDVSAGMGTRLGKGPSMWPAMCLLPHGLLSASSLIFDTVPKERVVGKPMIWQEYRIHNIVFGLRSVVCSLLAWASGFYNHAAPWRRVAVVGSCATALLANIMADQATQHLRSNHAESTTATMPYWEGCSIQTQKKFKLFYAYSQFMATLACIAVCNPVWGLAVLLAIQMASLLMTLVRKGLLSPKGYHIGYTITLLLPYVIGFRSYKYLGPWMFPAMLMGGAALFQLRRQGLNKYWLWLPIYGARIMVGDRFIPYTVW